MEEDKKLLEEMKENCLKGKNYDDKARYLKAQAIENILNELDRLKKENEELKEQVNMFDEAYSGAIKESKKWFDIAHDSIPKQVIQYKIEELNDVSNAEELEDIMDGKNYTITELVQYVLQELLESEE